MKFAPAVSFSPSEKLSVGVALHGVYSSLDLRNGQSSNYGLGAQVGILFKPNDTVRFGAGYMTPQSVTHENVSDFDGDGKLDDLKLEAPQQVSAGMALLFPRLLIEVDARWLNWSSAKGYEDFDWEDQWVFAVGAQLEIVDNLFLRAGYNYGKSPVKEHSGFNGTAPVTVQGKTMPGYYYETFRTIGFPAIVEHHVTAGVAYRFSDSFSLHLGYMHAFEKTMTETGTDIYGQPVTLESRLSEDSVEFGLTWKF